MPQEQGPPIVTGFRPKRTTDEAVEMTFEFEGGTKRTLLIPYHRLEPLIGSLTKIRDNAMKAGYLD
jgi:hypothetical protein